MNNHELFETVETKWQTIFAESLTPDESYVIDKYFKDDWTVLEAGCGGGRIALQLEARTSGSIDAFDYVEESINNAKSNESNVNFFVANASDLSTIPDNKYDCEVYFQNIISFVPEKKIKETIQDAYRVLKPGGYFLCSVLLFERRKINYLLGTVLCLLRRLRGDKSSIQNMPWLKTQGKPNWKMFRKGQPTVYWFKMKEIVLALETVGYTIIEKYVGKEKSSFLYLICKK